MQPSTLKTSILSLLLTGAFTLSARAGDVVADYFYGMTPDDYSMGAMTNLPTFPNSPGAQLDIDAAGGPHVLSTLFSTQIGPSQNYDGTHIRCLVTAPVSGNYTFYVYSDDGSELWFSTNANPANKQLIAYDNIWASTNNWPASGAAVSTLIPLVQGQQYYMEVLQRNNLGGDFVAVGWGRPDGVLQQPMSLTYVQPWAASGLTIVNDSNNPNDVSVAHSAIELQPVTFEVDVVSPGPNTFQWKQNGVAISGATNSYYIRQVPTTADDGTSFSVTVNGTTTSASSTLTVTADTGAPAVVSADSLGNPNAVTVVYSKVMDPASATNTANYSLVRTADAVVVPITNAILKADQKTVKLNLGASFVLTNYTITITGVKDAAASATVISPNPTVTNFWYGGNPAGLTFTFNDGNVPVGTTFATRADDNALNLYTAVTNVPGNPTFCLLLISNDVNQTEQQWFITNDITSGAAVSSFTASFKLWMGTGAGGNSGLPNSGGNGAVFHVGPRPVFTTSGTTPGAGYTGSASSWGNGLDVGFRTYSSPPNTPGINIIYANPASPTTFANRGTTTPQGLSSFSGYFDTNGAAGSFSNYVNITVTVNNGTLNLWCNTNQVYTNFAIPGWVALTGGGVGLPALFGFTTADGAGAHEVVAIDDLDLTVNGVHIATGAGGGLGGTQVGPVQFARQPVSVTTNENVYVTFIAGVSGATPYYYQWYSNGVAIAGATAANYTTPVMTLFTNNNDYYSISVSNDFSSVTSTNAILTIIKDVVGAKLLSAGSLDGNSIGLTFGAYLDQAAAANPLNYSINGGAAGAGIASVDVRTHFANLGNFAPGNDPTVVYAPSYLKTVKLQLSSPVSGQFTVAAAVKARTGVTAASATVTNTVMGMTDSRLGVTGDPVAVGDAFSGGTNQVEIMAGGTSFMPLNSLVNPSVDNGHFAYQATPRTGNFDVSAKVAFETVTAPAAKAGIMVRTTPTSATSPAIAIKVFPAPPGNNTHELAVRTSDSADPVTWAVAGANLAASWTTKGADWVRLQRVGTKYYGSVSSNGISWTKVGSYDDTVNGAFVDPEYVGVYASAANNDGRYCEADFANWGPTAFAGATVTMSLNLSNITTLENVSLNLSVAALLTATNATANDLTYQWQRQEPSGSTWVDIINANASTYATPYLKAGTDNGAKYRVIAFVGDVTTGHSVTSAVSTVTVNSDAVPPYILSAFADATFSQITVNFDGPVDPTTAGNQNNYTVNIVAGGVAPISYLTPNTLPGGFVTNVVLTLVSPLTAGTKYTVTVANVLDLSNNNINNTAVSGGKTHNFTGWQLAYGYLKYERWSDTSYTNAGGYTDVRVLLHNPNYPNYPNVTQLTTYSGYGNGDISNPTTDVTDFGARISGYFIPSTNGDYTWYVRGNDGTALYVSSDSTRDNEGFKALANSTANQNWNYGLVNANSLDSVYADPSPVTMTANTLYYVEAIEKQGSGHSWLEFTCGNPNPPGTNATDTGNTLLEVAGNPYLLGGIGGAPTNYYNLTGSNIAVYVNPDISAITVSAAPTNTTVQQNKPATFTVGATTVLYAGSVSSTVAMTYQWYSNNVALANATNASYTIPVATYPDGNGNVYKVAISVPGVSFLSTNLSATLTVVPDLLPPFVLSASGYSNTISIQYDAPVDPASATNAANYTGVTGGLTVTSVRLLAGSQSVLLTLSGGLSGSTFSVTINGVQDLVGNPTVNVVATGTVLQVTSLDLGTPVSSTTVAMTGVNGLLQVGAGGKGFGLTATNDGMNFLYEQKTGDFDVRVRVENVSCANTSSMAGLVMRQDLNPGGLDYAIVVEPAPTAAADGGGTGLNKIELFHRGTTNAVKGAFSGDANVAPILGTNTTTIYPAWLRLRRSGNNIYVYSGADGTNWYRENRVLGLASSWGNTVYVGMASAANNTTGTVQASFSNYGNFVQPSVPQVLLVSGNNGGRVNSGTDSAWDTPAGLPNSPTLWNTSDTYVYNWFISKGWNVTVVNGAGVKVEDANGMSLLVWTGSTSSGNTSPLFKNIAVPAVFWKANGMNLNNYVGNAGQNVDFGNDLTSTIIILDSTNPIVNGAFTAGQSVTVAATTQWLSWANKATLGSGLIPAAVSSANGNHVVVWYGETGAVYTTNTLPARRVLCLMGDNGPDPQGDWSVATSAARTLLTNAVNWATAQSITQVVAIATQPANKVAAVGGTTTFTVSATGPGPYGYQWYKISGGVTNLIAGATSVNYITPVTTLADDGSQFQVVVTGLNGSATSTKALLNVQNYLYAITQPLSQTNNVGTTATFTVAFGGSSPAYQWYIITNLVTPATNAIVGATSATYTTPVLTLTDNGERFFAKATNLLGSLTSTTATNTVINSQPVVIGAFSLVDSTHLSINWSNGSTSSVLLSSTNLAAPMTNWTPVVTNPTLPYIITIPPGAPQQFFRVQ